MSSALVREPCPLEYIDGTIRFEPQLPPHSVALVTLELQSAGQPRATGERR
ncbi:MAG: hypothetical protein H0V09_05790 [Gemmatimonadetes bacterium]|nr:hypothetical protein [Gemmatimonadota bacterium]